MKRILISFLFLFISFNLFSMPKGELEETNIGSQDSISLEVNKMEFSSAIAIIDRLLLAGGLDSVQVRSLSLQKVRCLKKLYMFNEAVMLLMEINERNFKPGVLDVEGLSELADAYISLGDIENAISSYSLLKSAFPGNLYYAIRFADLLYRISAYDSVIAEGKKILAVSPTHYSVLSLVGNSFNKIEESDSAMVYYNKMLIIKPMDYRVIDKMSKILLSKKMYSEVIYLTENYLSVDSLSLPINSVYGLALHLDTQYLESINVYKRLFSLGDSTYSVNYWMGLNNYMLSNYVEAEVYLEKAFQADSSDVNLVYHYAISTSWDPSQIDRTTKLLDYAYSLTKPDNLLLFKIYSGYATVYFKLKRYKEAIPYYIKSYKYNTSFVSALSVLGFCYEQDKDYKKAETYYLAYLKLADKNGDNYRTVKTRHELVKQELFWIEN